MSLTDVATTGAQVEGGVGCLVTGAADGDQECWNALVKKFGPMVWAIGRSMLRSNAEAADVSQTVWLSLVEHLDTINQPERVGAWLATTTRRECLRVQQRSRRVVPADDEHRFDDADAQDDGLDVDMLKSERNSALWDAFEQLPESSQRLLTLLMVDPPMSYQDISAALEMPIGSIGPTRGRILAVLQREMLRRGVTAADSRL